MMTNRLERLPRVAAVFIAVLVVAACAIERHRIRTGSYPASLDTLVPAELQAVPLDVLTGRPLQYRRTDGSFVLYSVGWDAHDDSGAFGKVLFDDQRGDWVWRYPDAK